MKKAVISGDIISSTSLQIEDRAIVERSLKLLLEDLKDNFNVYGRLIKGDYIECVVPEAQNALRITLAIKSFVKSIPIKKKYNNNPNIKLFKTHGIRLAIGYGDLDRFDAENGIIDGEAIYLSGRMINESSTHGKERVVIKNTLFFSSANEELNSDFEPLLGLLDTLIGKATFKQSRILYLKLLGNSEYDIARKLKISQSAVNQHSISVGWNSIEKALVYFNKSILKS